MDDAALIARYIIPDPLHRDPADARVVSSSVAVWELIRDLIGARGNVLQVAADYDLPHDAVLAVRTYYLQRAPVIDARIRAEARPRHAA